MGRPGFARYPRLQNRDSGHPGSGLRSVFDPAVHAGFEAAAIDAREGARDLVREEREVPGCDEQLRDAPDIFV